jgi:hypothetical protein
MLCELTPVLAEASRKLLDETADMSCAGAETLAQVEQSVMSRQFDALLLGATDPDAAEPSRQLLDGNPQLKIMCVSPDGRQAVLQERRLDRIRIENVSFDRIFEALRDACAAESAG